jgi:hypothetical protein
MDYFQVRTNLKSEQISKLEQISKYEQISKSEMFCMLQI